MTSTRTAATAAGPITITLGLAAASWVVTVWLATGMNGMNGAHGTHGTHGMDMGVAFWASMMAAMMLPGAVPAVANHARASGGVRAVPVFVASYLAVWAIVGLVLSSIQLPPGSLAAGAVVIAAGLYELTPLKRHCRLRCREHVGTGLEFGLYCVGSSIGLMLMLVALGAMSLTWMAVITVLVTVQKLLPAKPAVDVSLALGILGIGVLIVLAADVPM